MGLPYHTGTQVFRDPDKEMAKILSRSFGYIITPEQVNKLFREHWSKLSPLAHAIHDQQTMQETINGR